MTKKKPSSIDPYMPYVLFGILFFMVPFVFMGHPTAIAVGLVGVVLVLVLYAGIMEITSKLDSIKELITDSKNKELMENIKKILEDLNK